MNGHASQVDQIEKAPEKPSRASFSRSWLVLELVTLALTGLFLYSFLIRQQYRDVPMETIISAVSEGEGLTAMINEDRAGLRRCYGLDAGATEGFYFCRSSSNMEADELLIVKAADEAAARALVPAAQARLRGDPLMDVNSKARPEAAVPKVDLGRFPGKIGFVERNRQSFSADLPVAFFCNGEINIIMKRNGMHDGFQRMIAVRQTLQNIQRQIQLCRRSFPVGYHRISLPSR